MIMLNPKTKSFLYMVDLSIHKTELNTHYLWDLNLLLRYKENAKEILDKLDSKGYFQCDDNIIEFIAYLNDNGLETQACCSGHYPFIGCKSEFYVWFKMDKDNPRHWEIVNGIEDISNDFNGGFDNNRGKDDIIWRVNLPNSETAFDFYKRLPKTKFKNLVYVFNEDTFKEVEDYQI